MDDLSPEEIESLSEAMNENPSSEEEKTEEIPTAEFPLEEESTAESLEDAITHEISENIDSSPNISHAQFTQLEESESPEEFPVQSIEKMYDVKVKIEVVLGTTKMTLEEILKLNPGSVVELNKLAGEPVDIVANGKLIARAEVVVIEDNFGIKIIEIVGTRQKFSAIHGE